MSYLNQLRLVPSRDGETQQTKNTNDMLLLFEDDLPKCSNEATRGLIPHYMAVFNELDTAPVYYVQPLVIEKCMYILCAYFVHFAMTGKIRNYTKEQVSIMVPTFLSLHTENGNNALSAEDEDGLPVATEFSKITNDIDRWYNMGSAIHDILLGNRAFDHSSEASILNVPDQTKAGEDLISIRLACVNFDKYKGNLPTYTYAACKAEVQAILEGSERPLDTKYDSSKRWTRKQYTSDSVMILGRLITDREFTEAAAKLSRYIRI